MRNTACIARVSVAVLCRGRGQKHYLYWQESVLLFVQSLGVRNTACIAGPVLLFCV